MSTDEKIALTWRRLPARYYLQGTYCENCRTNYFPPRELCPKCRRKGRIVPQQFSGQGKIYSYTEILSPPAGFELEAPYIMAIIQLDEGPRVTSQIVNASFDEIRIGMPVEMVFRKIHEPSKAGLIHYGFKFRITNLPDKPAPSGKPTPAEPEAKPAPGGKPAPDSFGKPAPEAKAAEAKGEKKAKK